jgi:hypothetical protein
MGAQYVGLENTVNEKLLIAQTAGTSIAGRAINPTSLTCQIELEKRHENNAVLGLTRIGTGSEVIGEFLALSPKSSGHRNRAKEDTPCNGASLSTGEEL